MWKPIETAPRDGTEILLYRKGDAFNRDCEVSCWMSDGYDEFWHTSQGKMCEPTHWMSLPQPPGEKK